ncbi:MAG: heme exporter protein CcmB [Abitibacteriaceae bacterium]|nr:heme exporter protein CcmB [Abditibacteriaceae bacterium]
MEIGSSAAIQPPGARESTLHPLTALVPRATWATVQAVFWKDWRSEWRTRAALNSIALFSIASPVALSFSVARQRLEPETLAGLLWTVLLFAALVGLARSFVKEEESGTATLLRLSCPPDAVLWGKALFNLVLLVGTQAAAVPIFVLLLNAQLSRAGLLLLVLLLGDVGLAVVSSLLGAIASQARARGSLFAAIAVPLVLPLLVAASTGTAAAFGAVGPQGDFWPALQIMLGYDVAVVTAAWMLFDFVWSA